MSRAYRRLRDLGAIHGIVFHTPDVNQRLGLQVDFNLYLESDPMIRPQKNYLLRMETEYIVPINGDLDYLNAFDLVFTWDDSLVDSNKFIKLNYPNPLTISHNDGFGQRPIFCAMIAGNKFLTKPDPRGLYSARVDVIKWFQKNHMDDFHLYGFGWDKPARRKSGLPKLKYRVEKIMNRMMGTKTFPSYRGSVKAKRDILEKSRFSICYENLQGVSGYITEKIFDCFFSGCVPVYWGDQFISKHIPKACYIDRRQFENMTDLYQFLKNMPESSYMNYQKQIRDFLYSDKFEPFSSERFATTIVQSILKDFGNKE